MIRNEGEHRPQAGAGIRVGFSDSDDPRTAAAAFHQAVWQPDLELAVFFCSPDYDLAALQAALQEHFGELPLVGCTTAGEITPMGYRHGTLTGFSLAGPDFAVATRVLDDLTSFELGDGYQSARDACARLAGRGRPTNGECGFGFLLIDGQSFCEERVVHSLHAGLEDIELFGGSAGDGVELRQRPFVFADGEFRRDRAVFMLINTRRDFSLIKTENYLPGDAKLVITEAQPERRRVSEINGGRAAAEYAALVGIDPERLNSRVFAANPVGLMQGDEFYMRAIGWVEDDGTLQFACAIDEGVVLSLARSEDFVGRLRQAFDGVRRAVGPPQLTIACDCIFRLFEMNQRGIRDEVSALMRANGGIGFNTYGEQFNAMHVNHTLTGVAIGREAVRGDG